MKKKETFLFFLVLTLIPLGCDKSNDSPILLEISPDSEEEIIKYETKQVEFEFCLLNKENIPATIFDKGDNFTFRFSFKNISSDPIIVTTEFINSDFFNVYLTQNRNNIGKPWTGLWCEFSGQPQEIKVNPESIVSMRCPWILDENNIPDYPLCMAESKMPLDTGDYYTNLDLDFHYLINGKMNIIKNIKFQIKFKVK